MVQLDNEPGGFSVDCLDTSGDLGTLANERMDYGFHT
jgi:hypothetical protein